MWSKWEILYKLHPYTFFNQVKYLLYNLSSQMGFHFGHLGLIMINSIELKEWQDKVYLHHLDPESVCC